MDVSLVSTIALISLLAAVSPGPDFAIVTKNSLSGSFRTGLLTSLGVALALFVHVAYCILGIAFVIAESPILFSVLKYLGAAYLFYLGVQLLREKKEDAILNSLQMKKSTQSAFLSGFLCNLLNPKATLFVLSLFTQFIDPSMDLWQKFLLASVLPLTVFAWFATLSYMLTHRMLQKHFAKFQFGIVKVMGVTLCALSLYIVFENLLT